MHRRLPRRPTTAKRVSVLCFLVFWFLFVFFFVFVVGTRETIFPAGGRKGTRPPTRGGPRGEAERRPGEAAGDGSRRAVCTRRSSARVGFLGVLAFRFSTRCFRPSGAATACWPRIPSGVIPEA